jgi:hypothetical protein
VIVTASGVLSMAFIVVWPSPTRRATSPGAPDHVGGLRPAGHHYCAVLAVRLLEWATRIDVGSTIDSD